MKKLIKIVLILVLLLGIFMAGAMFLLSQLVKPEAFKERLTEAVALKTGRQLTIQGKVGVTVFPRFSAILRDVTLSNAPYFANQTFARAGRIEVQVEVMPLLTKKVKIGKVIFKDFNLSLVRKNSGVNNWSDLLSSGGAAKESDREADLPEIYIANVSVENAVISFDDYQAVRHVRISNLNLDSQGINFSGDDFFVHAVGRIVSDVPQLAGDFSCDSKVILDWDNKKYAVAGFSLAGNLNAALLQQQIDFSVGADVNVDLGKQEMSIDNLKWRLANMFATGSMRATNIVYAPNVNGDINIATFDPKPLLRAFGVITDGKQQLASQQQAWQSAALQATLQTTSKFLKIPKLEIHLNDSVLLGTASYSHFNDKLVVFNFDINHLDLDRYKGVTASQSEKAQKATAEMAATTALVAEKVNANVLERSNNKRKNSVAKVDSGKLKVRMGLLPTLRQVVLNGDVHVGDLQLSGMHFKNLSMQVGGDNGTININPFNCNFYQGTIKGGLDINISKGTPVFGFAATMTNVAVQSLFKDVIKSSKFSGFANLQVKLATVGNNAQQILRNLRGRSNLRVIKGAFHGIDVRYQIERVKALANGTIPRLQETQPPYTAFSQLVGNFNIVNGVANTNDLLLQAPDFTVKGRGAIDLAAQNLNLQLDASYATRSNFYVPIKVTGSFASPNIKPDVAVFMGQLLKEAVVQKVGQQLQLPGGVKNGKIDISNIIDSIKVDKKKLHNLLPQ